MCRASTRSRPAPKILSIALSGIAGGDCRGRAIGEIRGARRVPSLSERQDRHSHAPVPDLSRRLIGICIQFVQRHLFLDPAILHQIVERRVPVRGGHRAKRLVPGCRRHMVALRDLELAQQALITSATTRPVRSSRRNRGRAAPAVAAGSACPDRASRWAGAWRSAAGSEGLSIRLTRNDLAGSGLQTSILAPVLSVMSL